MSAIKTGNELLRFIVIALESVAGRDTESSQLSGHKGLKKLSDAFSAKI